MGQAASGRHHLTEALVLKQSPVGDLHRLVFLFTPDKGLVTALAPGAQKTKGPLRALSQPYRRLEADLYHDPVKDQYRLDGAREVADYSRLGEDLGRWWTACLWSEWLLAAGAREASPELFSLFEQAFALLAVEDPARVGTFSLRVGAGFLERLGWGPEWTRCRLCGADLRTSGAAGRLRDGVSCPSCAGAGGGGGGGPSAAFGAPAAPRNALGSGGPAGPAIGREGVAQARVWASGALLADWARCARLDPVDYPRDFNLEGEALGLARSGLWPYLEGCLGRSFQSLRTGAGLV